MAERLIPNEWQVAAWDLSDVQNAFKGALKTMKDVEGDDSEAFREAVRQVTDGVSMIQDMCNKHAGKKRIIVPGS